MSRGEDVVATGRMFKEQRSRLTFARFNLEPHGFRGLRFAAAAFLPVAAVMAWSAAQTPAVTGPVRSVVVLDPAHGGPDKGAKLNDQAVEKDVTLAMAAKLRQSLSAAGFTVVATRDNDPGSSLGTDQRAELANRQHALACLVLHATGSGSGVHLYASPLQPTPVSTEDADVRPSFRPLPWDEAQADSVQQSLRLQGHLAAAISGAKLPVLRGRASAPPLDNLTCPAIALELAPLGMPGGDRTAASDGAYQLRVANAVTAAMKNWRDDPASHPAPAAASPKAAPADGANQ